MPAYWIAHVTVTDPEAYKGYQALAPTAFAAHGARFLARGGDADVLEGDSLERHVVIEFPDLAAARACHASPEYQAARVKRLGACVTQIVIVDGVASLPAADGTA